MLELRKLCVFFGFNGALRAVWDHKRNYNDTLTRMDVMHTWVVCLIIIVLTPTQEKKPDMRRTEAFSIFNSQSNHVLLEGGNFSDDTGTSQITNYANTN